MSKKSKYDIDHILEMDTFKMKYEVFNTKTKTVLGTFHREKYANLFKQSLEQPLKEK